MSEQLNCALVPHIHEYSVTELSDSIKLFVEANFQDIYLRGEVQDLKVHSSGHVYLVLKDKTSLIDAICWKGIYAKSAVKLENGMEIICRCKVTTYPMRSKYQVIINSFKIAGEGALLKLIEDRKKKLAKEGIFSQRRPLPFLPKCIGVITSETGAVIRDIMHRVRDRNAMTNIILWPVIVQGTEAAEQIVNAIQGFNNIDEKPDILIIARGGGSLEDLMPFNEECLARAIYASQIPIISAVGHETDTTIADFAADVRAPTPTAAAEFAIPVRNELHLNLNNLLLRLEGLVKHLLESKRLQLTGIVRALPSMDTYLALKIQKTDYLSERLQDLYISKLNNVKNNLKVLSAKLYGYSYENTLKRGFAIVQDAKGGIVKSVEEVSADMELIFSDGKQSVHL